MENQRDKKNEEERWEMRKKRVREDGDEEERKI